MNAVPAGFFESDQLGGGGCLHHMLTGKTDNDVVFGEKYKTKSWTKFFSWSKWKVHNTQQYCFFWLKKSPKDLRGDVASWENEGGWETSGEVNLVTLRCKKLPFLHHHHWHHHHHRQKSHCYHVTQEGGHLLIHRSKRRRKDDLPSSNELVRGQRPLQKVWG